jgi:hypothetical protein
MPGTDRAASASSRRTFRLAAVAGTTVAAAGAVIALAPMASAAGGATPGDFQQLRNCESGGNYAINTGNGFYGAYQFDLGTWHGLGYGGYPNNAAPSVQDQAARQLQVSRGWSPWPACSARLGLSSGRGYSAAPIYAASRSETRTVLISAPSSSAGSRDATAGPAPAFDGTTLDTSLIGSHRDDVATWQQRMANRGWTIAVDGYFGPQSASVARAFATEKGLSTPTPGSVDAGAWQAAWTAPVT